MEYEMTIIIESGYWEAYNDLEEELLDFVNCEVVSTNEPIRITVETGYPHTIEDNVAAVSWQYPDAFFTLTVRYPPWELPERYYYQGGLRHWVRAQFPPFNENMLVFEVNDFGELWLEMIADPHCKCRGGGIAREGYDDSGRPLEAICECVHEAVRARGGKIQG